MKEKPQLNLLPVKSDRVFTVGPGGETSVAPRRKLTLGQRHAAWRIGLMAVDKFMKDRGFSSGLDSSTHFGWGKGNFLVNVSLRKPGNVAYVTSGPNYDPSVKRPSLGRDVTGQEMFGVTAQVTRLQDLLHGAKYVLSVEVAHYDGASASPIFIPLDETEAKPAHYVFRNVLGIIAMLCNKIPALKKEFEVESVKSAQQTDPEDQVPMLEDEVIE